MEFLFIDESQHNKKENRLYFVQLGMIVNEKKLLYLESEIGKFKEKCKIKNLKELKKEFSKEKRLKLSKELFKIAQKNNIQIISIILGNISIREKLSEVYFGGLTFILERFFLELKQNNKEGVVFCDSFHEKFEKELKIKINRYLNKSGVILFGESKGKYIERIYPSILFLDDNYSNIMQLADILCSSLQRGVYNFIKEKRKMGLLQGNEDLLKDCCDYLNIYWDLFIKGYGGNVSGWGIKTWI